MIPGKPLPYPDCWADPDDYVDNLLEFATTSELFQTLCGGVHVLDFFTNEPGLFQVVIPSDWQPWLLACEPMRLLDVLMRDDLGNLPDPQPPESLKRYINDVRRFSLARGFSSGQEKLPKLTRQVSVGMKPKKIHEVSHFANYVDRLAADSAATSGQPISHFVDFGSGQNYLGRALASSPYNKHVIAVEGREHNVTGAKELDVLAGVAEKQKVMRNKKLWQQQLDSLKTPDELDEKALRRTANPPRISGEHVADLRPMSQLEAIYTPEDGKGFIRYVAGRLDSGDLSDVVGQLEATRDPAAEQSEKLRLMAVSIHSCGNLSHYGIRSIILNPEVHAVAIVGCCYNLLTEKLGPPSYKHPHLRPSLQPLNGRVARESSRFDAQGFPMSECFTNYRDVGIRFNITARMMACQAPQNWTETDSDAFFTRHFFRAIMQKIFLDRGVIGKVYHQAREDGDGGTDTEGTPFNTSTNPVIIGSLRKSCYRDLSSYVRGAVAKLTTHSDYHEYCDIIKEKMSDMPDDAIARYEDDFRPRKRELSAVWSLMAFSAAVVESLIVTDRWLFLRQHALVEHCWAETVFGYRESPRNLVVVGIKRPDMQTPAKCRR